MSTSGWSFMDEGMFLQDEVPIAKDEVSDPEGCVKDESPHFKQASSEWQQGSTADPGPLGNGTQALLTPLLKPSPQPALIQDFLEEDVWEASSGSSSASRTSSCNFTPTVHIPSDQWISLSHPNAKLMLGLLGGRAEDQWE